MLNSKNLNKMSNIKCEVHWYSERANCDDENEGKHFGFYIFDCLIEEYDEEIGFGGYDVLDAFWFETEGERNREFEKF
jgi:hypothetical protein